MSDKEKVKGMVVGPPRPRGMTKVPTATTLQTAASLSNGFPTARQ